MTVSPLPAASTSAPGSVTGTTYQGYLEEFAASTRHENGDPEEWFGIYAIDKNNKLTPKGKIPETVRSLFAEPRQFGPDSN